MPSTPPRRAATTVAVGLVLVGLLSDWTAAGSKAVAASAAVEAFTAVPVNDAATATLARATVRCTGDAAMIPAKGSTVAYGSVPGRTLTEKSANSGSKTLRLGPQSVRLRNFTRSGNTLNGGVLTGQGLVGAGATRTTISLVPHSSTRRADVPHASSKTNQLSILKVSGNGVMLRGFLVRGTAQGHIYNGLRVDQVRSLRASHIKVEGIAGNQHQQPGETFGINDYKTVGSRWSHIVIDGQGVGASGFGVNGAKNITICGSTSRNNAVAMGFAFWQTKGVWLIDDTAVNNGFAGFNFERTTGTVTMIRPVAYGNRYDMRIASDRSSAKFRIIDPQLVDGVWTIWMPRTWFVKNRQKRSDVTLIIHGKQRNDLLQFRTY